MLLLVYGSMGERASQDSQEREKSLKKQDTVLLLLLLFLPTLFGC